MPDKLSVLRASLRVLKPGGLIGFFVIAAADHLSQRERAQLVEDDIGPEYLDAGPGYPELMRRAGFVQVHAQDITPEYLVTTESWIREREIESDALRVLWGESAYHDRLASQRRSLNAIRDGGLRRYLVTGVRP